MMELKETRGHYTQRERGSWTLDKLAALARRPKSRHTAYSNKESSEEESSVDVSLSIPPIIIIIIAVIFFCFFFILSSSSASSSSSPLLHLDYPNSSGR